MPITSTLKDGDAPGRQRRVVCPYLYEVINCASPLAFPGRHALAGIEAVHLGRGEAKSFQREAQGAEVWLTLRFVDRWMSGVHARLHRVGARWVVEDAGSTNGLRVGGKQVKMAELRDGDVLELGRTFLLFRASHMAARPDAVANGQTFTQVPDLEARFTQLAQVLKSPVPPPVLVLGEAGVGKERAARLVHSLSGRRGAFVPVNCGAIPRDLVASTLFGHVKGAFTGATEERVGQVKAAHQGTLFLDEVGELPLEAQPYLLRVLQEREVLPLGGTRAVPVDLQLVTATNRAMGHLQQPDRFRGDLLGRLSGFTLQLPPLRQRLEDMGLVLRAILLDLELGGLTFSPEAVRVLLSAPWPGNIRELMRTVQVAGALAFAQDQVLQKEHLPDSIVAASTLRGVRSPGLLSPKDEATRARLVEALKVGKGSIAAAARNLNKARMQVQRWLKRFDVNPEDFR